MFLSSKPAKFLASILSLAIAFNGIGIPLAQASTGSSGTNQKSTLKADVGELPNQLPKTQLELPSKRTAISTVYLNPDGSFTEQIYSEPHFYQDPTDKRWKPIDNSLKSSSKKPGKLENTANDFNTDFDSQTGKNTLVTVTKEGKSVSFTPVGASVSQGTAKANKMTYKDVFTTQTLNIPFRETVLKRILS